MTGKTVTFRTPRGIDITVDEGSVSAQQMERSSTFEKVSKRAAAPKAKAKPEAAEEVAEEADTEQE